MNRRQKKKQSKKYERNLKKFFKKQGIKLKSREVGSCSRYTIKPVIVMQSMEQLKQMYPEDDC